MSEHEPLLLSLEAAEEEGGVEEEHVNVIKKQPGRIKTSITHTHIFLTRTHRIFLDFELEMTLHRLSFLLSYLY